MTFSAAQSGARISTEEIRVRMFRVISSKPVGDVLKDLTANDRPSGDERISEVEL